jgi:hypothetical protein
LSCSYWSPFWQRRVGIFQNLEGTINYLQVDVSSFVNTTRKFHNRGILFSFHVYLTAFNVARICTGNLCSPRVLYKFINASSIRGHTKLRTVAMLLFFICVRNYCNKKCTTSKVVVDLQYKTFLL